MLERRQAAHARNHAAGHPRLRRQRRRRRPCRPASGKRRPAAGRRSRPGRDAAVRPAARSSSVRNRVRRSCGGCVRCDAPWPAASNGGPTASSRRCAGPFPAAKSRRAWNSAPSPVSRWIFMPKDAVREKSRIASSRTAAMFGVMPIWRPGCTRRWRQTRPSGPRQRSQMLSSSPTPRRSGLEQRSEARRPDRLTGARPRSASRASFSFTSMADVDRSGAPALEPRVNAKFVAPAHIDHRRRLDRQQQPAAGRAKQGVDQHQPEHSGHPDQAHWPQLRTRQGDQHADRRADHHRGHRQARRVEHQRGASVASMMAAMI